MKEICNKDLHLKICMKINSHKNNNIKTFLLKKIMKIIIKNNHKIKNNNLNKNNLKIFFLKKATKT